MFIYFQSFFNLVHCWKKKRKNRHVREDTEGGGDETGANLGLAC